MIYIVDRFDDKNNEESLYVANTKLKVSVPYHIAKSLPINCSCGFLLTTNYKLTEWACINPYCPSKNARKVAKVFEIAHDRSLGIGYETAKETLLYNNFHRHMDFFTIDNPDQFNPNTHSLLVRQNWVDKLKEFRKGITFAEFIRYFQIDDIGENKCEYLFSGINSVEDLKIAISDEFQFKMHIAKVLSYASWNSQPTEKVYNIIRTYLPLFALYEPYFAPFKRREGIVVFMTLTGNFSEFRPRRKLIDKISQEYDLNPIFSENISSKTEIVVYEEDYNPKFYKAINSTKPLPNWLDKSKLTERSKGIAIYIDDFLAAIDYLKIKKEGEESK